MDRISEMGENSYPNSSIDDVSVDSQEGSIERNRNSRRHTPSQVQALEAAFGENQYPDRRQKMELSTRLSMTSTQVQYWFQNRRTRLKVQMERNTRSTLELENRMLKAENFILRNPTPTLLMNSNERYRAAMSSAIPTAEHTVRVENAPTLEVGIASSSLSVPIQVPQPMQVVGRVQESDYLNIALRASGILIRMTQTNEPLWVPDSFSGGKQILNHDEYMRMFPRVGQRPDGFVTEATRAYGLVNFPRSALVHGLMDPVKWKAMFPGMIAKAGIIEVVTSGDRDTRNGALQLMYARQQVMTPLVPFRDTKFIRFCQRYLPGVWIIVDVPIDNNREGLPAFYYRRLPSGCIIYDMPDRKSAVQWIEHAEYDGRHIHQVYRLLMNMGLGAEKWLATLQRQCEYFATVYDPSPDSRLSYNDTQTLLKLAKIMLDTLCDGVCITTPNKWSNVDAINVGGDVRVRIRRDTIGIPGQPLGIVVSTATSFVVASPWDKLFHYLMETSFNIASDMLADARTSEEIARIVKGRDSRNAVSVFHATSRYPDGGSLILLQETCVDSIGSSLVYAPVDIVSYREVLTGGDSNNVVLLPSGLFIVPDGVNYMRVDRGGANNGNSFGGGGSTSSIVTVAFQVLVRTLPTEQVTMNLVETVNEVVSSTLEKIKRTINEASSSVSI